MTHYFAEKKLSDEAARRMFEMAEDGMTLRREEKVHKDSLIFGAKDHYQKLDRERLAAYAKYPLPKGCVIPDGERFKVIDGYHRCAAAKGTLSVFVGRTK